MTDTALWFGVVLLSVGGIGLAGTVYGYRSEVQSLRHELDGNEDEPGLKRKFVLLEGRLNQLARYVMDHVELDHEPITQPIDMDRPTPAQLVAPTVPDLEAQHPAPNADSYGRHASAA